jgi:transposase
MAEGKTLPAIAEQLGVHRVTVAAWGKSYEQNGLECLKEKPRTGRPQMIDGMQRSAAMARAVKYGKRVDFGMDGSRSWLKSVVKEAM